LKDGEKSTGANLDVCWYWFRERGQVEQRHFYFDWISSIWESTKGQFTHL